MTFTETKGFFRTAILFPVFIPTIIVIVLVLLGTISNPELAGQFFSQVLNYVTNTFGWFYMLAVAAFLIFIVGIAMSNWGNIKLGPDHAEPEYSFLSWFAMLFSAGYGIALLFFGVAEPVLHFSAPPQGAPGTIEAAKQAMQISYFHWGFHIWAIYGVVGLSLAYFTFRHGLPLAMRSTLFPFIGNRINGWMGHTVDTFAVLGTLFGIATTLGLSVTQINTGVNYLFPSIPVSIPVQIATILIITLLATFSVVAGMDKGIKRLSVINIGLAVALMLFVFIVGPTLFILQTFVENTGSYLSNLVERTFSLQAYTANDWIGNWTLFIFGWTISWAPFVGIFIAKISRGRTIRQFIVGIMLIPTIFTFLWFSVFGDTALHLILVEGYQSLVQDVQQDKAIALFKLYEHLPLTTLLSVLSVILIITFFVTSADSGALVIDSLTSGGVTDTPIWQRVFWTTTQGLIASGLLLAGGLSALQTASIVSALPFTIIMLIAIIGLCKALAIEQHRNTSLTHHQPSQHNAQKNDDTETLIQRRLNYLVAFPTQEQVREFIASTAYQSIEAVKQGFQEKDWPFEVTYDEVNARVQLKLSEPNNVEFIYEIRMCEYSTPSYMKELKRKEYADQEKYYRAEVFLLRGGRAYDVYGFDQSSLINDILNQFEKYLHFLHISPKTLPWKMENDFHH
ncbi:BCCT family transporter [Acinetobacter sp. NIPH 1852]|uniref:BCCT family transporter n=1 Tax=Acinetobacter sp. NIPH 1852 TaxID=2923428 RepID=UPI001B445904|nr:BCCT family transporter [Acinetobacter sp. NIPH 1852]MBP8005924.1 BCCT family transporter [Acinetobacter sp.]MCH7309232.1 BCCT family transporter [Acinetobacter sp. NIPH 1852]